MPTTYIDARDEIFGIVKSIFDQAQWFTLFGYNVDVRWPSVAEGSKPDMLKLWARISSQIVSDGQASLAAADDQKMYDVIGLLYIQLFCPRNLPQSNEKGLLLATALQAAFRRQSPTAEIWFRNQTITELPPTTDNYPINVKVEFRYRTLQPA